MSNSNAVYPGGCACGQVRYEITGKPSFVFMCHCRNCQRATGNIFATNAWFAHSAVVFEKGEPGAYVTTGDSGKPVYHEFCSSCGSPIGMRSDGYPDFRAVRIASLDNPEPLAPVGEVFTRSAVSWDPLHPTLPKFEGQVPDADLIAIMNSY